MIEPTEATPLPVRATFHEEFFQQASKFAADMLLLVPELEGIAVVPAWETQQPQLPPGLVRGRSGPLHTPQEVLHMGQQLHGTLRHVMNLSLAVLKTVDDRLGQMAQEIREKEERLRELDARLTRHT